MRTEHVMAEALATELGAAEAAAWDALARYKFQMFGYWAAIWVHLNRIGGFNLPNPWRSLVVLARQQPTREADQQPQLFDEVPA